MINKSMVLLRLSREFRTKSNIVIYHNTFTIGDHTPIISHQLQVENENTLAYLKVSFKRIKTRHIYLIHWPETDLLSLLHYSWGLLVE